MVGDEQERDEAERSAGSEPSRDRERGPKRADDDAALTASGGTHDPTERGADDGRWRPGRVVARRYEIERRLGSGAMGDVYLAHDRLLKKQVALKSLRAELAQSRDTVRRFLREVALAHSVTHRNVVRIYDTGEEDGLPFFTMEHLQGQNLEDLLVQGPEGERLSIREVREMCFDVLDAMEAAHRVGVVHRDLKPGNVMLTHRGAIVMDFGVAGIDDIADGKIPSATQIRSLVRTEVGTIFGSPAYMAPELWEGAAASVQSDLYAFGVMLYQMLTGRLPYQAKTPAAYLQKLNAGPPPPVRNFRRDTPWSLVRLVRKCMAHAPDERPASAAAAANLVAPLRSGRRRRLAVVAGTVALMGLGAVLFRATPTWKDYGLPDRLAEADLSAAVRAFDVGDDTAAIRQLDRLAGRAPDSAALAFWRATVRSELGDEQGRRAACQPSHRRGDSTWKALADAACGPSWSLAEPILSTLEDAPGSVGPELLPLAVTYALVPEIEVAHRPDDAVHTLAEHVLERLEEEPDWPPHWGMPTRWQVARLDLLVALGRLPEAREEADALVETQSDAPILLQRAAWLALTTGQLEHARDLARTLHPIDPGAAIRLQLEDGRLDRAWGMIADREGDPRYEALRTMWCGYAYRFQMTTVPQRCAELSPSLARVLWLGGQRADAAPTNPLVQAIVQRQREINHAECEVGREISTVLSHAPPPFELYLPQLEIEAALCTASPAHSDHKRAQELANALVNVAPHDPWVLLMHANVEEALGRGRIALNDRITVVERWRNADAHLPLVGRLRELIGDHVGGAATGSLRVGMDTAQPR